MFEKECRICGTWFEAITERRQLCDNCQKNSAKAQSKIDKAINESKYRLEELPHQQYYACKCEYCGIAFHSYGYTRRFCSTTCSQEYNIRTAVCPICGKQLYPLGIYAKIGAKCCSSDCDEERKLRDARNKGKTAYCKVCAKEFIRKKDWDEFCSKKCEIIFTWDIARKEGRLAQCKVCGKEFIQKRDGQAVCSTACHAVHSKSTPAQLIEVKCEICGSPFKRHVNAVQYTCSKACSRARSKGRTVAARKESAADIKQNDTASVRLKEQQGATATGNHASQSHLCTQCKTSQKDCEWFISRFSDLPVGAVSQVVNKNIIVIACPKHSL